MYSGQNMIAACLYLKKLLLRAIKNELLILALNSKFAHENKIKLASYIRKAERIAKNLNMFGSLKGDEELSGNLISRMPATRQIMWRTQVLC